MLDRPVTIKAGGDFDPVPSDKYTCQIVDVNLVTQMNKFKGKEQDMLNYQFVILDEKPMDEAGEETTRGRFLWKRCSLTLSDRAWLNKLAKAVYGRDLTKDEKESFDAESIVGKQVNLMVEAVEKDGVVYNNVLSFEKTLKPLEEVDFEPKPARVEKTSVPVTAPQEDPEDVIADLKKNS